METTAYVRTLASHPTIRRHKWSRPLLTESAPQTEIDLTPSKQMTKEFLTEARTHISLSRKRISNRELTMRRASASRVSAPRRTPRDSSASRSRVPEHRNTQTPGDVYLAAPSAAPSCVSSRNFLALNISRSLGDRYLAAAFAAPFCVSQRKFRALASAARIQPRLAKIPRLGIVVAAPTPAAHSAAPAGKRMIRDSSVTVPKTENCRSLGDSYLAAPFAAPSCVSPRKFRALASAARIQPRLPIIPIVGTAAAAPAPAATRGTYPTFSNRELLGLEFPQLADNKRPHPVLIANFEPNDFRVELGKGNSEELPELGAAFQRDAQHARVAHGEEPAQFSEALVHRAP